MSTSSALGQCWLPGTPFLWEESGASALNGDWGGGELGCPRGGPLACRHRFPLPGKKVERPHSWAGDRWAGRKLGPGVRLPHKNPFMDHLISYLLQINTQSSVWGRWTLSWPPPTCWYRPSSPGRKVELPPGLGVGRGRESTSLT